MVSRESIVYCRRRLVPVGPFVRSVSLECDWLWAMDASLLLAATGGRDDKWAKLELELRSTTYVLDARGSKKECSPLKPGLFSRKMDYRRPDSENWER